MVVMPLLFAFMITAFITKRDQDAAAQSNPNPVQASVPLNSGSDLKYKLPAQIKSPHAPDFNLVNNTEGNNRVQVASGMSSGNPSVSGGMSPTSSPIRGNRYSVSAGESRSTMMVVWSNGESAAPAALKDKQRLGALEKQLAATERKLRDVTLELEREREKTKKTISTFGEKEHIQDGSCIQLSNEDDDFL